MRLTQLIAVSGMTVAGAASAQVARDPVEQKVPASSDRTDRADAAADDGADRTMTPRPAATPTPTPDATPAAEAPPAGDPAAVSDSPPKSR